MPPRRRIDPEAGRRAVVEWAGAPEAAARSTTATAVRYTLEELGIQAPGRTVEVRVPPFGAVQCVEGPVHTRGTPPNVVEMDATTWLGLVVGRLTWEQARDSGAVRASGQRADVSAHLPMMKVGPRLG